jgi:hypothetical protein
MKVADTWRDAMNADRRKKLDKVMEFLSQAQTLLEEVRDEEQEYYDNMPEALQSGDKGEKASTAISEMEEVLSNLEYAESSLETAKE